MNQNIFKEIFIVVLIHAMIGLAGDTAMAQRMRMSVDERVKLLTEQLSLTKTQSDSVRILYMQSDSLRTKLRGSQQGDRTAMRELMRKIQDSTDAKIDSLLTKEQKEKFAGIKKQRPQRTGPPPGRRPDSD